MASSAPQSETNWSESFSLAVADVGDGMEYEEAADRLRQVIRTGLLRITDIRTNPERFFLAHRLLARHATRLGPGFWIRFTVHFNLFAGTVVALGSPQQIQDLDKRSRSSRPPLGCFGLTETMAGVNSGLVVETVASFVDATDDGEASFEIHTPHPTAAKNWISQGLVADEAVVIATLIVHGTNYGPQAFLVDLKDSDGNVRQGLATQDMGQKTVGNDLDNARLTFTHMRVPLSTLLCRYLSVDARGIVTKPGGNKRTMEMIGQRLFTGRVAVAQAAIQFSQTLFDSTFEFANTKVCWTPGGGSDDEEGPRMLSHVPQIRAIFQQGDEDLARLARFLAQLESQLCECLRTDKIPPVSLQRAVAVGKVKAVEGGIALCHSLKQEVGSYALMAGKGFEQLDFLQCCKFAEGDSRILMQKMARDALRAGESKAKGQTRIALRTLQAAMTNAMAAQADKGKGSKGRAWDTCWREVYSLAEGHMVDVLLQFDCAPPERLGASHL